MKPAIVLALALLAACGGAGKTPEQDSAGAELERAAIAAGIVGDPAGQTLAGAYGRGADRMCAVTDGDAFRIGLEASYGDEIGCSARGKARQSGSTVNMTLDGSDGCTFQASLEDGILRLPGSLPDGCTALCDPPASLAGLAVDKLSDAPAEVSAMRRQDGSRMCAG